MPQRYALALILTALLAGCGGNDEECPADAAVFVGPPTELCAHQMPTKRVPIRPERLESV